MQSITAGNPEIKQDSIQMPTNPTGNSTATRS